jgi:hypothetical protein
MLRNLYEQAKHRYYVISELKLLQQFSLTCIISYAYYNNYSSPVASTCCPVTIGDISSVGV